MTARLAFELRFARDAHPAETLVVKVLWHFLLKIDSAKRPGLNVPAWPLQIPETTIRRSPFVPLYLWTRSA